MSVAFTRPFQPLDLAARAAAMFSLGDMIAQLRREKVYRESGRNALTLIHDDALTVVLTVAKQGAECEDHLSRELTFFLLLSGGLDIESPDGATLSLTDTSAGALARDVRHKLLATSDCAYLLIIGRQRRAHSVSRGLDDTQEITAPMPGAEWEESEAVEGLLREVMTRIEAAPPARREQLRAYASDLLAADISDAHAAERQRRGARRSPLTFAALAFFLAAMGAFLLFVVPPVGTVLIGLSVLSAVVGILVTLTARGVRAGSRLFRRAAPETPAIEEGSESSPAAPLDLGRQAGARHWRW